MNEEVKKTFEIQGIKFRIAEDITVDQGEELKVLQEKSMSLLPVPKEELIQNTKNFLSIILIPEGETGFENLEIGKLKESEINEVILSFFTIRAAKIRRLADSLKRLMS